MLANSGEITPPCGVPATVRDTTPSTSTPACSHLRSSLSTRRSETRLPTNSSQCAAIFRTIGDQHKPGSLWDHLKEVGQHRLTDLVDPMGVLNDVDRWGLTSQRRGVHKRGHNMLGYARCGHHPEPAGPGLAGRHHEVRA